MKISNTILAVFQLRNHMSAKAAQKLMANLDYILRLCLTYLSQFFTTLALASKNIVNFKNDPKIIISII